MGTRTYRKLANRVAFSTSNEPQPPTVGIFQPSEKVLGSLPNLAKSLLMVPQLILQGFVGWYWRDQCHFRRYYVLSADDHGQT